MIGPDEEEEEEEAETDMVCVSRREKRFEQPTEVCLGLIYRYVIVLNHSIGGSFFKKNTFAKIFELRQERYARLPWIRGWAPQFQVLRTWLLPSLGLVGVDGHGGPMVNVGYIRPLIARIVNHGIKINAHSAYVYGTR